MANFVDYAREFTDSFEDKPFNTIDGMVLSELSYIEWEHIRELSDDQLKAAGVSRETIEQVLQNPGDKASSVSLPLDIMITLIGMTEYYNSVGEKGGINKERKELLDTVVTNPRFNKIQFGNHQTVNKAITDNPDASKIRTGSVETIEQWAAMTFTFMTENGTETFISFQGTDGTMEGWNEDFIMAYEIETAAQNACTEYLNRIVQLLPEIKRIRMGGHSKGGNDAIYAYLFMNPEYRDRIVGLYSYDGPGFNFDIKMDPEVYKEMLGLLKGHWVAPYDSVIGQLMRENINCQYVDANEMIFMDHSAFSWQLEYDPETGEYRYVIRKQSSISKYLNKLVDDSLKVLPRENRRVVIDLIWTILNERYDDFDSILHNVGNDWEGLLRDFGAEFRNMSAEEEIRFLSSIYTIAVLAYLDWAGHTVQEDIVKPFVEVLKKNGIVDFDTFVEFLGDKPVENLLSLVGEIITNPQILKGVLTTGLMVALRNVFARLLLIVTALLPFLDVLKDVAMNIVAAITAVIEFLKLAVDFIKEKLVELVELAELAIEFLAEKIVEFVEAAKNFIIEQVAIAFEETSRMVEGVISGLDKLGSDIAQGWQRLKNLLYKNIKLCIQMSNPFLATVLRAAGGIEMPTVTIDMKRLQNAVDEMARLADRVERMDGRLDRLYRRLTINNIEESEGVFTSIANMFNLVRSDILVDDGYKIRRKANNISSIYSGYVDVERWVMNELGL